MSDATTLATIKTQILARLADLTASAKPYYVIDGQEVRWTEYQAMLFAQLKSVNEQIDREAGPVEEQSIVLL